ncbi:DUF1702 family protein [Actinomadura sp. NPDC047616]|uniref:DUF1702 family protein n=1 Tax=Actinomadura sp. NPDC047616 TaxID=3155914 RepID=UPI0033CCF634
MGRRLLTPDDAETTLEKRGFHVKNNDAREVLERIGRTFLAGFGDAVESGAPAALPARLKDIPPRFRGFAYEGAGMGFAMVDALTFSGGRRTREYLAGCGDAHVYMVYIGVGWAMARLPRFRWPKLDLDPMLQWLVLDGYGFHQAYFRTERYVRRHHQDPSFPWPAHDPHGYANHALDQGIGRALWFVGGTDPDVVATLIEAYPPARHSDLYAGAGLAATYAGGADEDELRGFWKRAGRHRPFVAQGSAFAAEARRRAGLEVPHTAVATEIFCDMPPERAAQVCTDIRRELDRPGSTAGAAGEDRRPLFEEWRRRIADEFASLGRC